MPPSKKTPTPATAGGNDKPDIRFRMRVTLNGEIALGPGKVTLLEAIRSCGSISAAARQLDMSYRRAWLLIDELNRSLDAPATISAHGGSARGGCVLTAVGEEVVRLYREIETQAYAHCQPQIATLTGLLHSGPSRASERDTE